MFVIDLCLSPTGFRRALVENVRVPIALLPEFRGVSQLTVVSRHRAGLIAGNRHEASSNKEPRHCLKQMG